MPSALSVIKDLLEIEISSYEIQLGINPGSSPSAPSILHPSSEIHSLICCLTSCSLQKILYCGIRNSPSQFTFSLKGCSKTLFLHIILDTWKVLCGFKQDERLLKLVLVCAIKSGVQSRWEACYQDLAICVRFAAELF